MLNFDSGKFNLSQSCDSLDEEPQVDKKSREDFFRFLDKNSLARCGKLIYHNPIFLSVRNSYGETALHILFYKYCTVEESSKTFLEIVRSILSTTEINLMNIRDKFMHTPLYKAFLTRDKVERINNIVQLVTDSAKGSPNILTLHLCNGKELQETALHIAAREGFVKAVKLILNYDKTTAYAVNRFGSTPLHYAAFYGCIEVISLLLHYTECDRSLLDAKDVRGYTALHHATARNHIEVIQCLMESSANCDILNEQKQAYLDLLPTNKQKSLPSNALEAVVAR